MAAVKSGGNQAVGRVSHGYGVPARVWNFALGVPCVAEPAHLHVAEHAHAARLALLAAVAQQLHAYAYAQHWLREAGDHLVEPVLAQIGHGGGGLAHAGENHLVGAAQRVGVVGHKGLNAYALHGAHHRKHVAGIVFHYCYAHISQYMFLL